MATDKRLDQVSTLTDFDYALIVKGNEVAKVTAAQLASVVAGKANVNFGYNSLAELAGGVANAISVKTDVFSISKNESKTITLGAGYLFAVDKSMKYKTRLTN